MEDNLISSDLLKVLTNNGKIDVGSIVTQLQMICERQEILNIHNHNIWLASDGYWKTKVTLCDGKKRLIKKKNKSDLEDAIIDHYKTHFQMENSFKNRYRIWINRQRNCARCENTILKYKSDYKRFYEGYPIENLNIADIDEEILSKHILQVLQDKPIRWRAFKDIIGYTNGVFEKAIRDRLITENPLFYLDIPIYKKYCYVPPIKTTTERTLTDEDINVLLDRIMNPRAHNTNKLCCYAIEMALYTGMRVGELAALKWEDIIFEENLIVIRRAERFDRATKTSNMLLVKNGKERIFPLIDEIKILLEKIRSYEEEHGCFGEYVFQNEEGRVSKSKISDTLRNITMSDDFSGIKSIHAIRRTFNSKLKCNGVSSTIASSLLGHTERVNEQNYTYDVSELIEKRKLVAQIVTTSNAPNHSQIG